MWVNKTAGALSPFRWRKNGEYEADIIGIGHEGEGVGRVDGFTFFCTWRSPRRTGAGQSA